MNSVVYKSEFRDREIENSSFSDIKDDEILILCGNLYENVDCVTTEYSEELEQQEFSNDFDDNKIELELYYFKLRHYEKETTTFGSLLFSILNYLSLIIGLNIRSFITIFIAISISKIKPKLVKSLKIILISGCVIGFIAHSIYIFVAIVNAKMIRISEYEKLKVIKMPSFIMCFEVDYSNIDANEKITGFYLNDFTKKMEIDSIFEKVTIYNESLQQVNITIEDIKLIETKFKISHSYFFFDSKCWEFTPNITFQEEDLLAFEELFFVKIYLKDELYSQDECNCHKIFIGFFDPELRELEKISNYKFKKINDSIFSFKIQPNAIQMIRFDQFEFLKNPITIFKSNNFIKKHNTYYHDLYENFKKLTKHSTQLLSLTIDNFDLEIDDDLFIQYFDQIQKKKDNSSTSKNYETIYFNISPMSTLEQSSSPELVIVPFFVKSILILTSRYNFVQLLINIMNSLSLWLSLDVMSLHSYIFIIFLLFKKMYLLLLKFRRILINNI